MARKRSGSESRKFNTLVRMDDDLVAKARKVAALKGISMAEYLAGVLGPVVDRDLVSEARKLAKGDPE